MQTHLHFDHSICVVKCASLMRGKPPVVSFPPHKKRQSWNDRETTVTNYSWVRIIAINRRIRNEDTDWYLTDSVAFLQLTISRFWRSKPLTQGPSSFSSGFAIKGRKRTATRTLVGFLFPPSDSATRWAMSDFLKPKRRKIHQPNMNCFREMHVKW